MQVPSDVARESQKPSDPIAERQTGDRYGTIQPIERLLQTLETEGEARHSLPDLIVEIAGDAPLDILLSVGEPPHEIQPLGFRPLECPDISKNSRDGRARDGYVATPADVQPSDVTIAAPRSKVDFERLRRFEAACSGTTNVVAITLVDGVQEGGGRPVRHLFIVLLEIEQGSATIGSRHAVARPIPSPGSEVCCRYREGDTPFAGGQGRRRTSALLHVLAREMSGHGGRQQGSERQADRNRDTDAIERMTCRPVEFLAGNTEVHRPGAGLRQRAKDNIDGHTFERLAFVEAARRGGGCDPRSWCSVTALGRLLGKTTCNELAPPVCDGADPPLWDSGSTDDRTHRVGGHLDRQHETKHAVPQDRNAKSHKLTTRN